MGELDTAQLSMSQALERIDATLSLEHALLADIRPQKNPNEPEKWPLGFAHALATLTTRFEDAESLHAKLRVVITTRLAGKTRGKGSAHYVTIADLQTTQHSQAEDGDESDDGDTDVLVPSLDDDVLATEAFEDA